MAYLPSHSTKTAIIDVALVGVAGSCCVETLELMKTNSTLRLITYFVQQIHINLYTSIELKETSIQLVILTMF